MTKEEFRNAVKKEYDSQDLTKDLSLWEVYVDLHPPIENADGLLQALKDADEFFFSKEDTHMVADAFLLEFIGDDRVSDFFAKSGFYYA